MEEDALPCTELVMLNICFSCRTSKDRTGAKKNSATDSGEGGNMAKNVHPTDLKGQCLERHRLKTGNSQRSVMIGWYN